MDRRPDPLTKPLMLSDLVANFQRLSSGLPLNDWEPDPSIRQLQREDSGILNFRTVENANKNVLSSNAVAISSSDDALLYDTDRLPEPAERDLRSGTTGENRPSKKRGGLWGGILSLLCCDKDHVASQFTPIFRRIETSMLRTWPFCKRKAQRRRGKEPSGELLL